MKRVNWKKLRSQIPNQVKIGGQTYEIVWISEFFDGKTLGETRFDPPQIVLKTGESDKVTVLVYGHEVIHAASDEEKIGLTEAQVLGLENALTYLLKPDNVFGGKK